MRRVIPSIIVFSTIISVLSCAVIGRADNAPPASVSTNSDVVKDWNGSVALGLAVTQGNSKTLTANGAFDISKLWKRDEWRLGADGQYGVNNFGAKTNEVINAENIHGFVDYKHLFTERLYGDVRGDAWHDDVADLQNREVVGPAIGYYFIKSDASRLERRGRWQLRTPTSRRSATATSSSSASASAANTLGANRRKSGKRFNYLPKIDDFSVYLLISEIGAEAAMNTHFSLRVVFQDRYNSAPATGRVPNDLAILASLVYKFGDSKVENPTTTGGHDENRSVRLPSIALCTGLLTACSKQESSTPETPTEAPKAATEMQKSAETAAPPRKKPPVRPLRKRKA